MSETKSQYVAVCASPANGSATRERKGRYVLAGIGVTEQEETLLQAVLSGNTLADAYRKAYSDKCSPQTATNGARQVLNRPRVASRMAKLTVQKQARDLHNRAFLGSHALERLYAESVEAKSDAARVAAAVKLAEIAGLFDTAKDAKGAQGAESMKQALVSKLNSLLSDKG